MGGADVKRFDVESAPAEETGDARQNPETVLDQDSDGVTHSPPSKENAATRSMPEFENIGRDGSPFASQNEWNRKGLPSLPERKTAANHKISGCYQGGE